MNEIDQPQPTGEAAPLPVPLEVSTVARVRCGLCGHEREADRAAAVLVGSEQRWPCLAGCFRVGEGDRAVPRMSCYALPTNCGG